tara:strand:- start:962 stop:1672 length:711 start_codon:yes stop_codon:yes gene_type:complete
MSLLTKENKIAQKIAIIGSSGYVGSNLFKIAKKKKLNVIGITRGQNIEKRIKNCKYIFHCANSGKRFNVNQNPDKDFIDSVVNTKKIISYLNKNQKLILISSISARTQLDTFYGLNRYVCELLIRKSDLIIRLGPIFGGKKNGPLYDIINNKNVYVDGSTKSAYAHINYYVSKILKLKSKKGIIELGAKDKLILKNFRNKIGSQSKFLGLNDDQYPLTSFKDAPSVNEVYKELKIN